VIDSALYLKHYPRKNDIEFDAFYGAQSLGVRVS